MQVTRVQALIAIGIMCLLCLLILTLVHYEKLRRRRAKNERGIRYIRISKGEAFYTYIVERCLLGFEFFIYRLNEAPWMQARKYNKRRRR